MNINIYNPYVRAELYHHGIMGQRWGKRNGPPYPLGAGDHSASEKKAGWRKSLNKDGKTENRTKVKKQSAIGAISGTIKLNNLDQRRAEWNRRLMYRERAVEKAKYKYDSKLEKYGKDSKKTEKAIRKVERKEKAAAKIASRMGKTEAKAQKILNNLKASGYTINSKEVKRYASDGSSYMGYYLGGVAGSIVMTALDYKYGYGAQQKGTQYRVRRNKY